MDPTLHLPLEILRSDPTPPAPNRSDPPGSAIDWLPHFLDLSWLAYAASSLLVVSHLPSPLSDNESAVGPIFLQVFELSGDPDSRVEAVSWSPVTPSVGEVAAATENCVWVFSHDSASSKGSFCWSQNAVLVHSAKVEAIEWTGSGDGIIASGIEVVLWKRHDKSWEIAWKFKTEQPQRLVSATWSVEGPFATAAYQGKWLVEGLLTEEASKCVLVCQQEGKHEFIRSELQHPRPVSMIQWRPLSGRPLSKDAKHPSRHVLLTGCLDGTVRLWCEVDDGRARKVSKDTNDHKTTRWSFSVAAVIEINQALNGILGIDIYVTWAVESRGVYKTSAGSKQLNSAKGYEHDQVGNCEWLVGYGPGMLVRFWALHCLDEVTPVRFPWVTLWKTQDLQVMEHGDIHRNGISNSSCTTLLNKVVISRDCLSGPPEVCSLIQLLPCNSLVWSLLYNQTSNNVGHPSVNENGRENSLSCSVDGHLNLDGHAGRILQVAVHPYSCELELAVSLDSDGLLLFWVISTISNNILGRPTLIPMWEICGKLATQSSFSRYTSVRWAPSIVNEAAVLLIGHAGGIDCFVVKLHQDKEENIECHYLSTIPFTGHGSYDDGPNSISTVPLPLTCLETRRCSKFMLLGVWMNGFEALSWEVTLHTFDLSGGQCDCDFETVNGHESIWRFEGTFASIRCCLKVNTCSSQIPDSFIHDEVTSFAVVCPGSMLRIENMLGPTIDQCSRFPAYLMATGCSNGTVKLWKSKFDKLSGPNIPWELVGMFLAHKGPISSVCLSDCGQKIATVCKDLSPDTGGTLHIWTPIHVAGVGSFMLEDTVSFDQELVALKWLSLGNGQLLLGVCMVSQLQVYSLELCGGQTLLNPEKTTKKNIWVCIASTHTFIPICDFFWGPRATAIFIHKCYFCVNSQWLFLVDKNHLADGQSNHRAASCMESVGGTKEDSSSTILFDCELQDFGKTLLKESMRGRRSGTPFKTDMNKDHLSSNLFIASTQLDCASGTKLGLWTMLEVLEKLSGPLPVYHPEALFMNIYSGNWKRAYIALRHLNDFLSSGSKHYPSKSSRFVPQISLSTFLDGIISKDSDDKGYQWGGNAVASSSQFQTDVSQFTYNMDSHASNNLISSSSTNYGLVDFVDHLEKLYELAAITNIERVQILAIFDLLIEMTNSTSGSPYESLDEPGRRFWISLRFQQLHFFRKFGRSVSVEEFVVDSKLIAWAYPLIARKICMDLSYPMNHLGKKCGIWV